MENFRKVKKDNQKPIYFWDKFIPQIEQEALQQLDNIAGMDFIESHIAVMPDAHLGKGATVGSVIPTSGAIIPSAVGVDIGCGMYAIRTTLKRSDIPDSLLHTLRTKIEEEIPHGRTSWNADEDKGSWGENLDSTGLVKILWDNKLSDEFKELAKKYPKLNKTNNIRHLGTLGTGNHFIEICYDQNSDIWVMLHSGSRGVGNSIGQLFIELAKNQMGDKIESLPDKDLSYLLKDTEEYNDYILAVDWAQKFAKLNRYIMMEIVLKVMTEVIPCKWDETDLAIDCHHNYIDMSNMDYLLTRKGAISAEKGEYGIIPSNMGNKSYIVKGLGNKDSFCSCSHGAGRVMTRTQAKKTFTCEDQIQATQGVECRKDSDVIDEIPMAYKNIDLVMKSQSDLVEIVYELKQIVNIKG